MLSQKTEASNLTWIVALHSTNTQTWGQEYTHAAVEPHKDEQARRERKKVYPKRGDTNRDKPNENPWSKQWAKQWAAS